MARKKADGGSAEPQLTPAQKGAATRRANQEKRRLAALEIPDDSPRDEDGQEPPSKGRQNMLKGASVSTRENEEEENEVAPGRAIRSRRSTTERARKNGQGEEQSGARKRAASSAEPRAAAGSATKAPKKRKSDVNVSNQDKSVPMEVDEDGDDDLEVVSIDPTNSRNGEGAPGPGDDVVEPLQIARPRARFAGRSSRSAARATRIASQPLEATAAQVEKTTTGAHNDDNAETDEQHPVARLRSRATRIVSESSDEEGEASNAGAGGGEVEERVASDEAEGDETWAKGDDVTDAAAEDEPAPMKTSKALALQFEQATPIFKKRQPSAARDNQSNAPHGGGTFNDPDNRDDASRRTLARVNERRRTRADAAHDSLEVVQNDIGNMSIDQDKGGPDHRPLTSRRTRRHEGVDGSGERREMEPRQAKHYDARDGEIPRERAERRLDAYGDGDGDGEASSNTGGRHGQPADREDRAPPRRRGSPRDEYDDRRDGYDRNHRDDRGGRADHSIQGGRQGASNGRGSATRIGTLGRRDESSEPDDRRAQKGERSGSPPRLASGRRDRDRREVVAIDDSEDNWSRGKGSTGHRAHATQRRSGRDGYDDDDDDDEVGQDDRPRRRRERESRVKVEPDSEGRRSSKKDKGQVRRRAKAGFIMDEGDSDGGAGMRVRARAANGSENEPKDGRWFRWTTVKFGPDGRPTLRGQDDRVAEVLSLASATEVPKFVCFQDAFPLADDRVPYYRMALTKVAKHLKEWDVLERLENDPSYVSDMAIIPEARMSIFRGKVRDKAVAGVKLLYHFALFPENEFVAIVAKLLEDQRYIYPGDEAKKTIQDDSPYCHAAIIAVIYESFFGGDAVKKFPVEFYPVSPRTGKRQLPKSMVAFSATVNEAALKAYQMGPTAVKVELKGDVFDDVYSVHLATLDQIYSDDSEVYDGLMTYLYDEASHGLGAPGPSTSARRGSTKPITIITANMAKRFK
ncbi:hypothetical protein BV25DRAFT_1922508 [Artomyces pyxidatus]|uniref:Uncharacterized protein n=1 Tax=Artomyces pyxidatus TaxID=48021 RepID=A0ACB8SEN0_9AGAM|nr:hypothetical protein BV25DRAFT_1922508 [Artomyces pyxidatus]